MNPFPPQPPTQLPYTASGMLSRPWRVSHSLARAGGPGKMRNANGVSCEVICRQPGYCCSWLDTLAGSRPGGVSLWRVQGWRDSPSYAHTHVKNCWTYSTIREFPRRHCSPVPQLSTCDTLHFWGALLLYSWHRAFLSPRRIQGLEHKKNCAG